MQNIKFKFFLSTLIFIGLLINQNSHSCTNFQLSSKDNNIIVGRTMEFGVELDSKVIIRPRNMVHVSSTPDGSKGLRWKSKYGYITADSINLDIAVDGFNEKGLSSGMLWMPGSEYEEKNLGPKDKVIDILELSNWILGNFATVDEVKRELPKIQVWAKYQKTLQTVPQIHLAVHDANGKSIVIEFLNGKKIIHDNDIGVLTNAPSFDWHINNLRNYAHIVPTSKHTNNIFGGKIAPNMIGSSLIGIPNDYTPPSRFVRMAAILELTDTPENNREAIRTTEHIISSIDIPKGLLKEQSNPNLLHNYTQWVTIKDLTNKNFYFRSYEDLTLRKIELSKIDLNDKRYVSKAIPIRGGEGITDITHKIKI